MNKLISSDVEKCVKCGICTEICPMGVIGLTDEGYPEPKTYAYKLCINCGYCVDVCVSGALSHRVRKRSSSSSAAMKRYRVLHKKKRNADEE